MMTLGEQIEKINPETVVSLKNKYGVYWIGKAKFVFGAVRLEAWNGTHIEVSIKEECDVNEISMQLL